jgi:hypothetical protein
VQAAHQPEAVAQAFEPVELDERLGEPRADAKVFRARRERLGREAENLLPVGDFDLALPLTLLEAVVLTPRLADLVEQPRVVQVLARRVVARDRREQGHDVDLGG